ncbi:phage protein Gp36 family protein [Raineya sp.]
MFLQITDYRKRIRDNALMQMIESNTDILDTLEKDAQSFIETHLRSKYDVATIFAQTGDDRHKDIVMIMIDIVIYYLVMRVSPKQAQETRVKLYEDACKWLTDVRKGNIVPDLPVFEPNKNRPSGFRFTSKQSPQDMFY